MYMIIVKLNAHFEKVEPMIIVHEFLILIFVIYSFLRAWSSIVHTIFT